MKYDFEAHPVGPYKLRRIRASQGAARDDLSPSAERKHLKRHALERVEITLEGKYVWSQPTMRKALAFCRELLSRNQLPNPHSKQEQ